MNKNHVKRISDLFKDVSCYNFSDLEFQEMNETIRELQLQGVLQDLEIDNANAFRKIGDFPTVLSKINNQKKEERKNKHKQLVRDVLMLFIGAIFGGTVEYILFVWFGIGK